MSARSASRQRAGQSSWWAGKRGSQWAVPGVLFALAVILSLFGLLLAGGDKDGFHYEGAKALLTLAVGLVLGGALKTAVDNHLDDRAKKAGWHSDQQALCADLQGVHEEVETARLLIEAHKTAKTYGERMRETVAAHVVLLQVARRFDALASSNDVKTADEHFVKIAGYLRALGQEYKEGYWEASQDQRFDEAVTARNMKAAAEEDGPTPARSHRAWSRLENPRDFPVLLDFRQAGDVYVEFFLLPYRALAKAIGTAEPGPDDDLRDDNAFRDQIRQAGEEVSMRCRHQASRRVFLQLVSQGRRRPQVGRARAPRQRLEPRQITRRNSDQGL
jgi:hypothetical protein